MQNSTKYYLLGGWMLCLALACSQDVTVSTCFKDTIAGEHLLSVADAFAKCQSNKALIIIEVSKEEDFKLGHLPGAINLWRPDYQTHEEGSVEGMRSSRMELQALLRRIGVTKQTELIIYDRKGGVDAMRFAWVLEYYGFASYSIINGGLTAWQEAGYLVDTLVHAPQQPSTFELDSPENTAIVADFDEVLSAIGDTSIILVDTRESYEYLGQPFSSNGKLYTHKKGAFTHGCLPGAVHLNWSVLSDLSGDHRIKCQQDLEYDLAAAGINPNKKIIVYCQSGSRSAHTAYVLRHILRYPHVKNYDGSWIEWSGRYMTKQDVPIEQKTEQLQITQILDSLKLELKKDS